MLWKNVKINLVAPVEILPANGINFPLIRPTDAAISYRERANRSSISQIPVAYIYVFVYVQSHI